MRLAGVPFRVSENFAGVSALLGYFSGRSIAGNWLADHPAPPALTQAPGESSAAFLKRSIDRFEATDFAALAATHEVGWVWGVAGGLVVVLVYALSILAHELGHLYAARRVGVTVDGVGLHATGGYVEMEDPDFLTAGSYAAIIAAGPAVTGLLALVAWGALAVLGWSPIGRPAVASAAGVVAVHALSAAALGNTFALAFNLLPVRPLDGGELVVAARMRFAWRWARRP